MIDDQRERPGWDETWMTVALTAARRSMCDRAKVGAVIVTPENRIVATGYNGPPTGIEHSSVRIGSRKLPVSCLYDCPRSQKPPHKLDAGYADCITVHAEMNALMFCDRVAREAGTLYVTGALCFGCAKAVANSGLARVVCMVNEELEAHRDPAGVTAFLRSAGMKVENFARSGRTLPEEVLLDDLRRDLRAHLDTEADPCAGEWPCDVARRLMTVQTKEDV